ncbi:MAG: TonB-dependent receptor [Bacteroidales bacterium]|nr:TonB-dependent receptor [Bacteroidales bacterium]
MKKSFIGLSLGKSIAGLFRIMRIELFLLCFTGISLFTNAYSQNQPDKIITGTIVDASGQTLPGVTILVKGTNIGAMTNLDGFFTLPIPVNAQTLVISFIGMGTKEIDIGTQTQFDVTLEEERIGLDEVVVIGYGQQKKESVVGAISQVSSDILERTGGVANLAQALTGQLPGVTTIQSSGEPGNDDPKILIRGMSTWNNAEPLVLVDGVERKMNDIDISEVESISILKDASATAVFGVKGAEGVILIRTKRGKLGKTHLTFEVNSGIKVLSRTPDKFDSYRGLQYRNNAIEYELPVKEQGWGAYTPIEMLNRYRKPQAPGDEYIFPNVDWKNEMLKDFAFSHRVNLNITGGTAFTKYFGSISYINDSDILKSGLDNGKGYKSKWAYQRFNFRSNIDLNLTSTTTLSVNLSGYLGVKNESFFAESNDHLFAAFYQKSPNVFPVRFPDGTWGYTPNSNDSNPVSYINNWGLEKIIRSQVNTDFRLKQQLDFITEGLSAQASLSYDNRFYSSGGIFDQANMLTKYIYPDIINKEPGESDNDYISYSPTVGINDFDFYMQPPTYLAESMLAQDQFNKRHDLNNAYRRIFYQFQINYTRTFNKHDVGVTALMNREEYAKGSRFPTYREDWVGRVTYNYDRRYLFESNAAYNGSEKFAKDYRFGFFPSVAVGWLASNEKFMQKSWLNTLKFRYSIGKVGNDSFSSPRWAYETIWAIDSDATRFGTPTSARSPYTQYIEAVIGNPFLQWEVSIKQNLGLELAVLKNMFNLNIDLFRDDRSNIFMDASQRNIPNYFGAQPVAANIGETETKGYEIELRFHNTTSKGFNYWFNCSYTHAIDKIIYSEDPELMPDYQKKEGFQIGQNKTQLHDGYLNNWDEVYASVYLQSDNQYKLPGDLRIIDFNGDGTIDTYDDAPNGYPLRPQSTYNFSLGFEYKGFSANLQFYGVYNVSRPIYYLTPFSDRNESIVFNIQQDVWSQDNNNSDWKAERFQSASPNGQLYIFDGSYLRFKTAEISYTINSNLIKQVGISSARVFLNGNNLFFWSDMPDDREDNSSINKYPTIKRFNLGVNINF